MKPHRIETFYDTFNDDQYILDPEEKYEYVNGAFKITPPLMLGETVLRALQDGTRASQLFLYANTPDSSIYFFKIDVPGKTDEEVAPVIDDMKIAMERTVQAANDPSLGDVVDNLEEFVQ